MVSNPDRAEFYVREMEPGFILSYKDVAPTFFTGDRVNAPLDPAEADAYWHRIQRAVGDGRCILLVAQLEDGTVAGTVQLDVDTLPNQPHRATVSKLLVHTSARRRGIGEALMAGLEDAARDGGRWLLTLDTATPDAVRLHERMGWAPAGAIPKYALNPDSSLTATTFYWKELSAESRA